MSVHSNINMLRDYVISLKNSKKAIGFAVLAGLLLVVPSVFIPLFSKIFIDYIVSKNKGEWLFPLLGGMLLTAVCSFFLTFLMEQCLLKLEIKLLSYHSAKFVEAALNLSERFFKKIFKGVMAKRISSYEVISKFLSRKLVNSLISLLLMIFYLGMLFIFSWQLALLGIIGGVVNVAGLILIHKKRVEYLYEFYKCTDSLAGYSDACLYNLEAIKANGSQQYFYSTRMGLYAEGFSVEGEVFEATHKLETIPVVVSEAIHFAVILLGGYYIIKGNMSAGELVAVQSLMAGFIAPLSNLVSLIMDYQNAKAKMLLVSEVTQAVHQKVNNEQGEVSEVGEVHFHGHINVENLELYDGEGKGIIKKTNFKVASGDTVAVTGSARSGKSALLASLIHQFKGKIQGEIYYDEIEIRKINKTFFHPQIAFLDMTTHIFTGTIRDNISLMDSEVSEDEIVRICIESLIHESILERDMGYEHVLIEEGRNLSFSERIKLEIARTLLKKPAVMILDMTLDCLGRDEQKRILQNIKKSGITLIVATNSSDIIENSNVQLCLS